MSALETFCQERKELDDQWILKMMTAAARDHDIVGGWKQDKDMKYSRYFYQTVMNIILDYNGTNEHFLGVEGV